MAALRWAFCCLLGVGMLPAWAHAAGQDAAYYDRLRADCAKYTDGEDRCCRYSANAMQARKGFLIKGNACPSGYIENMLKCVTSYKWCEPEGLCWGYDAHGNCMGKTQPGKK